MKKVRYEYDQYDKKVDAMRGRYCIATLRTQSNEYEVHEEMSEEDKDLHYEEMKKEAERFDKFIEDSRYDEEYNHRQS